MGDVWLVRHGATEWSRSGRHTSTTDLPLLPEGEEAARALGPRLAAHDFALVLTSPAAPGPAHRRAGRLRRAEVDDDLVEWGYGAYEGLTTDEIRETVPGWTVWTHPCPGGETAEQVAEPAGPGGGPLPARRRATPCCSATGTRCGRWRPAGWRCRSPRGDCCASTRAPSRCSATSASSRSVLHWNS